jgi:putative membrane-bound dehydrogenase-like protein
MRLTAILVLFLTASCAFAADGNRLAYLQECNPYYPSRTFAKLTTPQWVGDKGVEAVVILAIDDMKSHEPYEKFLRPILNRLKKIDGRAPLSIMTCSIDPKDPHLQKWLKEGLSLECHTIDHPCPFFKDGFAKAKSTYERCVDLLSEVPGNKPVAFRMPCCDSMNTPSPRFYAEIFNKTTDKGNFLQIDSSVFNVFTPQDKELPRAAVLDEQGRERFRKYLPTDRSFVNTIEDYPYPYVIDRLCWEFPCVTPSDWQAQNLHGSANPLTLRDWKAALDCVVAKQGVFTMVFHPYGWSTPQQHVDLIDYAVAKYGKKVKFLTFREALERLNKNLLGGVPLRERKIGLDNGVRLLDVDNDGYVDVVIGNGKDYQTRRWSLRTHSWRMTDFPVTLVVPKEWPNLGVLFGVMKADGKASLVVSLSADGLGITAVAFHFNGKRWLKDPAMSNSMRKVVGKEFDSFASRLVDVDGDGRCELIAMQWRNKHTVWDVFSWDPDGCVWKRLPFGLPRGAALLDVHSLEINLDIETEFRADAGLRFVDINGDGQLDLVFSNDKDFGVYLFKDIKTGWSRKVMAGKAGAQFALPLISHQGPGFVLSGERFPQRENMGFWVHSHHLWWANENTVLLKDHVARRSFAELLKDVQPGPRSPAAALKALHPRPGFVAEQVVCEPLVKDPIAFAWGPDGKLWVVEMGDYPLGTDGKGKPGGKVKYLQSSKGDGHYDKMTVFLDNLPFPTGVLPWKKGVLVTDAPDIFYAEDTDGDGKADKKVVLFTGFVQGNQQHRVNTLAWGLDNWIYCANGDSGGVIKSVQPLTPGPSPQRGEGRKAVNISGRDLRIRPDTGELEAVIGNTQYGRSRDDWGNWFGNNNSNPLWNYPLDDHYIRRNPHFAPPTPRVHVPVEPGAFRVYPRSRTLPRFNDPGAANHFTSACSPIIYRDELFGPAFAGSAFISEPVHNLVHREILKPQGVTFKSRRAADEQQSEFLASEDNWFRPTMIQTGPDGALWVADMYRQVIEHPQWIPLDWQKKLDLRAGHDLGRIYRVYPEGKKPRAIPRLDKLDIAGLVAALDSPSGWQRDMAHMVLLWRQDRSAVPLLEKMAAECKRPLGRLHAVCTLDGLGALSPTLVLQVVRDSHPGIRRHAVRLSEPSLADSFNLGARLNQEMLGMALLKLVDDPDAQVRLQLAYTLGNWDDPRAGLALGELAVKDAGDPYITAGVMSSLSARNLDQVLAGALGTGAAPPSVVENLLGQANAFGKSRALLTLLKRVTTPEKDDFAPWQYAALAGLLDTFGHGKASLLELKESGEMKEAWNRVAALVGVARRRATDPKIAPADRALAVRLLGRGIGAAPADRKLLASLLVPQEPAAVQAAAVDTLGKQQDGAVPTMLLRGWKGYAPGLRTQVLDVLLRRAEGARAVLDAVEKKQVLPFEIDAARRQRLLDHKQADLRRRAAKLFAAALGSDRQKVIDAYQGVLALKGQAARGQALFTKSCAICHKLAGAGNEVGPDLSSLADKSSPTLLIAVLDPNRAVEARYVNYVATTRGGLTLTGVLTTETGNNITLVGPDGKAQTVLRTDLEELVSTGKSAMPEGLEKDLRPQDLADIFEFIRTATIRPAPVGATTPGSAEKASSGR